MAFFGENTLQLYYEYDRNYETKPFHMSQVWRKEKKKHMFAVLNFIPKVNFSNV